MSRRAQVTLAQIAPAIRATRGSGVEIERIEIQGEKIVVIPHTGRMDLPSRASEREGTAGSRS